MDTFLIHSSLTKRHDVSLPNFSTSKETEIETMKPNTIFSLLNNRWRIIMNCGLMSGRSVVYPMKGLLFIICFFGVLCLGQQLNEVSVYQRHGLSEPADIVTSEEGLIYFSDKLRLDSLYSLNDCADKDNVIQFLDHQYTISSSGVGKPQLIIIVNEYLEGFNKSFVIKDDDANLFTEKFSHLVSKYGQELTKEISYLGHNEQLAQHFKPLNYKLTHIWSNLIENELSQSVFTNDLKYVSDKVFINEMSSLAHLNAFEFNQEDILVVNLNLLLSLANKIGKQSTTYKSAKQLLSIMLETFNQFEITIIKDSFASSSDITNKNLSKRSKELELVFDIRKDDKKSSKGAKPSYCFESEEDCQVNTSNCHSHGICSKFSKECWSCVCSSSFNDTSSKTTNWSGFDCSKKDISSSANLLLWSGLTILIMFASGIKLLMSIGNEPLPGVLDATSKSS